MMNQLVDLWVETRAELEYAHACLIEMDHKGQWCRSWDVAPESEQLQYLQIAREVLLPMTTGNIKDRVIEVAGELEWVYQTIGMLSQGMPLPKMWCEMSTEERQPYLDGAAEDMKPVFEDCEVLSDVSRN